MGLEDRASSNKSVKCNCNVGSRYKLEIIKAPHVGTFYVNEDKSAGLGLRVGDMVKEGQIVGYYESMNIMNEIKSGVSGVIWKILILSGNPVEFGQKLYWVKQELPRSGKVDVKT